MPMASDPQPVGLVVVGHEALANALLAAARHVVPRPTLPSRAVDIAAAEAPEAGLARINAALAAVDHGGGVLILADALGATPCNLAERAIADHPRARLVAGANLAMLVRVYNYAGQSLETLAMTAESGGHRGIRHIDGAAAERPS